MQIGSLFDNRLDKGVKYSYRRRGLDAFYAPDNEKEELEREYYDRETGNLFFNKEVSWHNSKILLDGVDIRIEFDDVCFIDHINLTQGKGMTDDESGRYDPAQFESIDVLTLKNGEYEIAGTYKCESGKAVSADEIFIPVGVYCENLTIRINSNFMPVAIKKLDVWGAWDLVDNVWPLPKSMEFNKKTFPLSALKAIKAANEDEKFAAEYFNNKLTKKTGLKLDINENKGDIVLNIENESETDYYKLSSKDGKVEITGTNRRSLLYGLSALLQLIDGDKVKHCEIDNEYYKDFRGVHFAIPEKHQLPFMKSMVENVFIPMNYNIAIIEICGGMRYKSHPKITEKWIEGNEKFLKGEWPNPAHAGFVTREPWEHEEVRAFCDYLESFGLEVVPEIQSWGHTQYITMAYPETAELDMTGVKEEDVNINSKDVTESSFYEHTMCPNHPRYYEITFDLIDEIVSVFKPKRYVHMGHDEIYRVGTCNICQKIPKGEIFAKEVTMLNNYIKKKGLNMMIWSDMLQCMAYSTPKGINSVPKDILMLDFVWYFHLDKDIEDNLLSHGFEVAMGNMYTSHYPRFEARMAKEGMVGGQVSAWVTHSEISYATSGKMYEFIYAATSLTSAEYNTNFRRIYNEIVLPIIKDVRYTIGDLYCEGEEKSINIGGSLMNIPYDIRGKASYPSALSVSPADPEKEIKVDDYAKIISFVNVTDKPGQRIPWHALSKLGEYVINYEDGTSYKESLLYTKNIYKYKAPSGDIFATPLFRHQGYVGTYLLTPESGKTYAGEDYTLGVYTMKNPNPEKKIKTITMKHEGTNDAKIILFDLRIK